jgi:hypothetical protein
MIQRRPKYVAIIVLLFGVAFGEVASKTTRFYRSVAILARRILIKKRGFRTRLCRNRALTQAEASIGYLQDELSTTVDVVAPLVEGGYVVNGDLVQLHDFFGALRTRVPLDSTGTARSTSMRRMTS